MRSRHSQSFLLHFLGFFSFIVSCTTNHSVEDAVPSLSETQTAQNKDRIQGQSKQGQQSPAAGAGANNLQDSRHSEAVQTAVLNVLAQIQGIEKSYSRADCSDVAKRTVTLRSLLTPEIQSSLPLSTLVAMAECAARNQPDHKEQAERALTYLNEAAKNLTPPWDILLLLATKAERLEKMGRSSEAIQVRQALSEQLRKNAELEKRNALSLQSLDPRYLELTATERAKINEFLLASYGDSEFFETLRQIESVGSQSSQNFQILARTIRDRIIVRIEKLYAEDISAMIATLQSGQKEEAKSLAEKIKRRFPTLNYTRRTDATFSAFENERAMPLSGPVMQQQELQLNTADMTIQQRVAQAREALAQGRPDQSVQYLRAIPENSRNAAISQLLSEAENAHIRDLRLRVRDLFKRAETSASPQNRKADYEQSLEILRYIVKEYPNHSTRKQIEKNIRNIEALLQEARK